jgi:ATP-dependent Clp protease ATP-binding subunit ClpA/alpha-tubulin suppressor-like RCC1 family protein
MQKAGKEQDTLATYGANAIESFKDDNDFLNRLRRYGIPWKGFQEQLKNFLPKGLSDSDEIAYKLVPKAMTAVFGEKGVGWKTEKRPSKSKPGETTTWVLALTPMIASKEDHVISLKSDRTVVAVGYNEAGRCEVGTWRNITQVAAGAWHTVGLKEDGTVVAVGHNEDGRCEVGTWRNITQVAAGRHHTVGLKEDGTVVAVGYNEDGQCEVGTWRNITQVAAGGWHTVGLKEDGTVVAVGRNDGGQCEVDDWEDIIQVDAERDHTVGLKEDGTVVAVGHNDCGQCGVDSWRNITQVTAGTWHTVGLKEDGTVVAVGRNDYGQCGVDNWDDITQVVAGEAHTVGLKEDGTVVAVGRNDYGQCGVDSWRNITQVTARGWHTVGLKEDGTVVAVGRNDYGQCGVDSWRNITQVAAGGWHTVGLKEDGTVVAVGYNNCGRCEVGTWRNITQVAAGAWHTVGLKEDGTVVAVGDNKFGQCKVDDWEDITQVAAGGWHTVGLKEDGTVVAEEKTTGNGMASGANLIEELDRLSPGIPFAIQAERPDYATNLKAGYDYSVAGDWDKAAKAYAEAARTASTLEGKSHADTLFDVAIMKAALRTPGKAAELKTAMDQKVYPKGMPSNIKKSYAKFTQSMSDARDAMYRGDYEEAFKSAKQAYAFAPSNEQAAEAWGLYNKIRFSTGPIDISLNENFTEPIYVRLTKRIYGQEVAFKTLSETLANKTSRRRTVKRPEKEKKPIAVFLAVGPTGVGKTETAKALAKILLGYECLTFAMNEFYDRYTVSRLMGSPPGYIGSDQGGQLTRPMFENLCRLILFDEIEKADPSIMNVFLSIFDEGSLVEASTGRVADFSQSIIFLTSNLANEEIAAIMEKGLDEIQTIENIKDVLHSKGIKRELLGRIDAVIPYSKLSMDALRRIAFNTILNSSGWNGKTIDFAWLEKVVNVYKPLADKYGVREFVRQIDAACFNGKILNIDSMAESIPSQEDISKRITQQGVASFLKERVIGQDDAIDTISRFLTAGVRKKADKPSDQPIAVFLAVGPTGVGKTETAKALAEYMKTVDPAYDLLTFNMAEFYDDATQSALTGSPPGYIGSDQSGRLTGAVRANPKRVILFDEIEKADPKVMDVFLSIFDEGKLTDTSKGFTVLFKDTVIFLTSNLKNQEIGEIMRAMQGRNDAEDAVRNELKKAGLRPEIVARIKAVLPYRHLNDEDYKNIIVAYMKQWPASRKYKDLHTVADRMVREKTHLKNEGVRGFIREVDNMLYLDGEGNSGDSINN